MGFYKFWWIVWLLNFGEQISFLSKYAALEKI